MSRNEKFRPGALVLLRRLDTNGNVATIWGGKVLASQPDSLRVLAIEMVELNNDWHCLGDFAEVTAPPHRVPFEWGFPRLLVPHEASPGDLAARPVLESALERFEKGEAAVE